VNKNIDFEKSLEQIEEIVTRLEKGQITLEESMKLYEVGAKKIKECSVYLDRMEKKISVATDSSSGDLTLQPISVSPKSERS
jgi:exodeoxyribonuclease VII small subunit